MKTMVIDGNSIVNRAFFGIRMLNAPDGTPTNGIYGFLSILGRLVDEERPEALCVAFDLKAPTFRHLAFDGYKAKRRGMPEELAQQMPILKQVLDAMGILRLEQEGWEADDILGTVSRLCEAAGEECVIVSGDRDSLQLVTDKTRVLHVKSSKGKTETVNYTASRFFDEYGFEAPKMVDLKALMGDASDNIPGVPGVGEKTAMDLLHRFGSVDALYSAIDSPDIRESVRKKLVDGRESAKMSFELATIRTDAPISFTPEMALWDRNYKPELYSLFLRLGFQKFIAKYGISPPAENEAPAARTLPDKCSIIVLRSLKEAEEEAKTLKSQSGTVTYWLWGSGLDNVVAFISFSGENRAYCLNRKDFESGGYADALGLLFAPDIPKAGHNIKEIQRALLDLGLSAEGWTFDTALAAWLLDATAGSYELDRLCLKYCGMDLSKEEKETSSGQLSLLDGMAPDDDAGMESAASMAAALAALQKVLEASLREQGMEKLFYDIELPLCQVLAEMEQQGVLVDREALRAFGDSLTGAIDALQKSIWLLAGEEFNINSPKQLGAVLFDKLLLPAGKKTKSGWSTNADVLEKLRDKHPIINEILDYRMLTKLKSTYADGLLKVVSADGRIHTSFQMTATATGRLSSTEPNLQNIPIRKELGAQLRGMFVAPEGKVLVDADYSQIELRLLAHISQDENMIAAFRSGEDVHAVTASQVFGVPLPEVTRLQRSHAKAVNFGIVYGISAWSLAQDIGVFPSEAKAYMDAYLEKYSGVRAYQKEIVEKARREGHVSTLYGRRRALPELKSSNFATRSFGERVALNMPIQGAAADLIKLAMVNVSRRMKSEGLASRLILQVHDELIAECPAAEAERVKALLSEEMENAARLSVPLTAEAKAGRSWADAH